MVARLAVVAVLIAGAYLVSRRALEGLTAERLEGPNLVLITIDTLRADHLGAYGYARDTSPAIDRLAAEGTLFEQVNVQWPKTNPSMASMMSSTYCLTNGVREYGAPIDPKLMTLARIMDRAGYYCASFVANAHLGYFFNFDRGFDEVHELWTEREYAHPYRLNESGAYDNDRIAALVCDWIDRHKDRTFFLWLHLLDPHGPYEPPEALELAYVPDELYRQQEVALQAAWVPFYQRRLGRVVLADYVARYDGEVAYSDQVVGRVVARLQSQGLAAETLLVVGADHGESLGEHGYYFDHGEYMYEASLRVPLIFYRPGSIPQGRRIATPVGLIDLLPTVLELLGLDASAYRGDFQGRSFAGLIRGEPAEERPIFSEGEHGQRSVRRGRWKLIDDPRPDRRTGRVRLQLYDLERDPMETDDLAEQLPEIRDELYAELQAWTAKMEATVGRYETRQVDPDHLAPELRQWLKAMGYIE